MGIFNDWSKVRHSRYNTNSFALLLSWGGVCALGKPKQALFEIKKYDYIVSVAIAIAVGIFFIAFIETEDTIYVWDSGTYWEKTLMLYASLTHSVTHTLTNILSSINESNYNNLVPFLLATPLHLAGGSREAFIGIVFFLFCVPTIFLFSLTLKIITPNSKLPLWLTTIIGLTLPMMFVPILGGWLDMSSVLLLAFLLLCFFSNPKDTVFDKNYCFSIAIAVLLILVFRRTFSIWVGAFVVVVILHYALLAIRSSTKSERMFLLKQLVMTYGVAALIVAAFMLTLFFGLAKMLLFDNHAAAYIGYKSGNSQLIELFSTIGAPYVILIALGTILSFLKHISKAKVASLYILSIIVVLLFWRIQDMGEQHYYLLAPQILLMIYASCEILRRSLRWSWIKGLLSLLICIYACFQLIFSTIYQAPFQYIFSSESHHREYRSDIDEISRLVRDIPNGSKVFINSSSSIFGNDTIPSYVIQRQIPSEFQITGSDVDARNGFDVTFFDSDYLIVCEPVQTHLKEGSQHIVTDLYDYLIDKGGLAKHYEYVNSYNLDNKIDAYLYKQTTSYTPQEMEQFAKHFDELYPDQKDLFYDRIMNYSKSKTE